MAENERDDAIAGPPSPAPPPADPAEPERRGALRTLVTAGSLLYAASLAVPAARFLTSPAGDASDTGAGAARFLPAGKLADLPEGRPVRVALRGDLRDAFTLSADQPLGAVWLLRRGESVSAWSAACPHLGCAVDLAADQKSFTCPCHTSRFALDGTPEAGPAPRALDPLAVRVTAGVVEVDLRRFRQGIAERVEVGA
ncbi:MAG: Rieske (2Fe-2S) protein [Byssovorax sp.]